VASSADVLAALPLAAASLKRRRQLEQQRKTALSLHEFVVEAWPYLEPSIPFVDGKHVELLCAHLEACSRREIADLLINVPPGLTISNLCAVLWPAWSWTRWPYTRWITASYDQGLSIRDAVRTRRLMQSEWYQEHWGAPFRFASDQYVKSYFTNNAGGWRFATSMRGAATGYHAHVILVDDPHLVSKAESDLEREAVLTAWREVFASRRLPGGCRVAIGQREVSMKRISRPTGSSAKVTASITSSSPWNSTPGRSGRRRPNRVRSSASRTNGAPSRASCCRRSGLGPRPSSG
jgi:hypothetical protein